MSLDDPRAIFIGPEPSVFTFLAIASIFESEISGDPKEGKGYHMMLGAGTTPGSHEPVWELIQAGFLNVQLQLEQTGAALSTTRLYRNEPMALFLAFLGSIAGVMGVVIVAMRFSEKMGAKFKTQHPEDEEKPQN